MTVDNHVIGRRVAMLRAALGLSQRELAEKAGVQQSAICRVERNGSALPKGKAGRIARALKVRVKDLTGEAPVTASL